MDLGYKFGSATISYGLCLIKGQQPDENNSFFISLGVILENEGILCLRADFFLFPIISIDKIFLLAPLIILLILPLDGETNIISGLDFE